MTVTVDSLITNSRSIANTAAANVAALKASLGAFVGAQYPHSQADLDYAKNAKTQVYAYRQPGDIVDSTTALDGLVYGVKLPEIPDWIGSDEFGALMPSSGLGTGRDNASPYAKFMTFMETLFPAASDITEVQNALDALVSNPPQLDSVVDASAEVTEANYVQSLSDAATLFSARGMPTPSTYASGIATHVQAIHVERNYDRAIDRVADDVNSAEIVMAQLRGLSSLFGDYLSARSSALNAIGGYLNAYLAELSAPMDIANSYTDAELGLYENELNDRVAKLGVDDMVRGGLVNYFQAFGNYQRGAQEFTTQLADVNVKARTFLAQGMADTGTMDMGTSSAYAEAYARKAAAATSALGSILSSAVTSFA